MPNWKKFGHGTKRVTVSSRLLVGISRINYDYVRGHRAMHDAPKYVVIRWADKWGANIPEMFIFSSLVTHVDFINKLGYSHDDVLSAGFVSIPTMEAYGESLSLGIKSNPDDTALLKRTLCFS